MASRGTPAQSEAARLQAAARLPDHFLPANGNEQVFTPEDPQDIDNLRKATLFTRLDVRAAPIQVIAALDPVHEIRTAWTAVVRNVIFVFDREEDKDDHIEHVRLVLEKVVRANSMTCDIDGCVFNVGTAAKAGLTVKETREAHSLKLVDKGMEWAKTQ